MDFKLSALALSAVLMSGCSSIVSDSKYNVAISSEPSEATFILKNKAGFTIHSGRTPSSISLDASSGFFQGETYTLIINKKGYEEKIVEIDSSIDGWYFGNLIFGSLIGFLIVDPATGAMFKLPEHSNSSLKLKTEEAKEDSLTITFIDDIPESQRASLIRIN
ncbi:hypothetical protein DS885_06365 [Psychromonas sp. B3M02]|uniref:hypothetical protein n=1 Tax=Psychromonas sp. B3M02 TaxID=2267226 RepID=UPI000DEBD292|nr:hypothetical protein [Psychromonas sp. B3M02]RBW46820.1 hypothetical protein DS885_06365 [Psychromonas sp. B3M02]